MTAYNNNASILAVVEETTGGTLKAPSASSEYMALQTGFELSPEVETIETEEIKASIGPSKTLTGLEKPSASWRHYLRGSGTQGDTPDWHLLAKSIFGSTSTNSTERTTTTSSTSTVIKLGAGGSDFALGKAMLIKKSTYEIRPVDSVSTNDVTLGFAQSTAAPGSGISVGKCINYTPVSSGHPTLSTWLYRANGAAVEAMAGGQVSQMNVTCEVGQPLNVSWTLGGTKYFFNPIIIASTNKYIDITTDNVTDDPATIPEGAYRTPHELAAAVQAALIAADGAAGLTCTYSDTTGKFTIAASVSTVLSLLWNTGANTANTAGSTLGFVVSSNDTGATTYTSDNAVTLTNAISPALDSSDPLIARDMEVLLGSQSSFMSLCVQSMNLNIGLELADVTCISSSSGIESRLPVKRSVSIEMTVLLSRYDAGKFDKFFNKTEQKFLFNFGAKSGGNWVAGRCGCFYAPQVAISGFRVSENNSAVVYNLTISPYVDASGNPEIYLNLL